MVVVGPVQPPLDQVVDVIAVRHGLVSAVRAVGVRGIAADRTGVVPGMFLIDGDHVFVDVLLVRMVQMAVMEVVDVIVVVHGDVAAIRSVPVRVGALMDLVGHAPDHRARWLIWQGRRERVPGGAIRMEVTGVMRMVARAGGGASSATGPI
jgi:hypothetical protein